MLGWANPARSRWGALARGIELAARASLELATDSVAWQALLESLTRDEIHGSWRRAALLALVRSERSPDLLQLSSTMRGYTADVCVHEPSGLAAVTAPRGGLVTFWDLRQAAYVGGLSVKDVAGVALTRDGSAFVVSNGHGELQFVSSETLRPDESPAWRWERRRWDNHLSLLLMPDRPPSPARP